MYLWQSCATLTFWEGKWWHIRLWCKGPVNLVACTLACFITLAVKPLISIIFLRAHTLFSLFLFNSLPPSFSILLTQPIFMSASHIPVSFCSALSVFDFDSTIPYPPVVNITLSVFVVCLSTSILHISRVISGIFFRCPGSFRKKSCSFFLYHKCYVTPNSPT